MNTVSASGRFLVGDNYIKIITNQDFCLYYMWLYQRAYYNIYRLQRPAHGAHINVIFPPYHHVDCNKYRNLNSKAVGFQYDVRGNHGGGKSKNFKNFWLNVYCPEAERIQLQENIPLQPGFSRFHITIGNTKNFF